jgi:hypothetical protein
MRQLSDIIEQMLVKVPENHILYNELVRFAGNLGFTAPEMMGLKFRQMHEILSDEIGMNPNEWTDSWKFDVIRIWMDKPDLSDDQIKQLCVKQ